MFHYSLFGDRYYNTVGSTGMTKVGTDEEVCPRRHSKNFLIDDM